jgi:hypothetical protein
MFYGIIQEEYIFEFDFNDSFNNLKKKVKNAIISFINKVEELLNRGKDNKIKQALRYLFNKAKKLLGVTEKTENKEDLEKITKELEDYRHELDSFKNRESNKEKYDNINWSDMLFTHSQLTNDIYEGRTTVKEVRNRIKEILDEYGPGTFPPCDINKYKYPKPWTKDTLDKLRTISGSGACSIEFYLFFAQVADEVYKH